MNVCDIFFFDSCGHHTHVTLATHSVGSMRVRKSNWVREWW